MKAADLRKSILQAAVQGKLVPQNPHYEPAAKLLERIRAEKAKLITSGKLKKEKPLPPITEDEVPYDLPDGWVWCRLGDMIEKNTGGGTPSKQRSDYWGGDIPWASVKDMNVEYINKTEDHITIKGLENSPSNLVEEDSIIVCTRMGLGKIAVNRIPLAINQDLRALQLSALIDKQYFILAYKTFAITGSGMTVKGIKIDELNRFLFPLPPLVEQQRIVVAVNGLMALCDELETAEKELDTLESQFAEYLPKSILQAAVQGKLVPQNIHDEPAGKLLECIRAEKAKLVKSGKLKKEKPLPPITEDEIPYDLPDGWKWCRLGDVCQVNPRNKLADEIHVSFIPMTLISSDFFGGHQQEQRIWREVKSGFTHFAEGDIVIAKITPCFQNKKSCIMRRLKNGFGAGTTELHVLRPIHVLPEYILIYAKSPDFLDDGVKNMTGTAGQQRVPTEFVRSALIPVPPLAEQQRIVAKVNELMTLCDALKAAHETPVGAPIAATVIPFPHQEEETEMLMAARGAMPKAPSKTLQDARNRLFED